MNIKAIPQGSYQTNSYVLNQQGSNDCVIIDTGLENDALLAYIEDSGLNPKALLLTHGHLDHIYGIPVLREKYPEMKVYIHEDDSPMLGDADLNMSSYSGIYTDFTTGPADEFIADNQELEISGICFKFLHIPGHTKGGVAIYLPSENVIFTGDCLFAGSIGRTDFPGYAEGKCRDQLVNGIKEKILPLNEEIKLMPGHGPSTTIRCEKKHNPYLSGKFDMFSY